MKRSAFKKFNSYNPDSSSASKLVKIGEASELIGVSIDTLRRWEKKGWLKTVKTPGGTRLYDKEQLVKLNPNLKRGPKSFISPLVSTPAQAPVSTDYTPSFSPISPDSQIHLNSDLPILKISESIKPHQIESDIENSFSQTDSAASKNLFTGFSISPSAIDSIKKNIQLCIVIFLLALPVLLLSNYISGNQKLSSFINPGMKQFSNSKAAEIKDITLKLANIFSPSLSHSIFGTYPTGSPPGSYAKLNNKNPDQLASRRVSGDLKGSNFSRTTGEVLADSTPSGSYLQINLDTQINGSLSVDTASVSGQLSASTINTGFGDNEVYPMDQALLTTSEVTFGGLSLGTLTLTGTSNQLTLGNTIVSTQTGGSGAFTVSIPTLSANGNFVIDNATQTLTNKTISGSSNTLTDIPTSALSSSSITVNAGTGLSGGGSVSLGGSITISATGSTGAVSSITGTSNQVVASASTGDITLSLPQDIATTSSPTFASLLLTGSTSGTLTLDTAATTTSYTLTLPADDGTSGYVLQTDGSGNTSWVAQSGGGASTLQAAYDGGNTITTTTGRNIGYTLASGLASSTSFTLTNAGTANAFILNDTNVASNISLDIQSGGVTSLTITEAGTVTTTGNISTSAGGTISSDGTLMASDGFTMSTGAISLTATSGSISATGLTALTYTLSSGTAAITAPTLNLNTSSTGNTALGNATGTFALTSNGGLNVTTGGALTGVASIDTIATSATALTFAGTGTVGATTTALNLQADGTIDVNIAGGSSATGCTITNSNGNLACSGTITANGTVLASYWDRTGTTLSPLTAGDNITTSGNISTSGSGTVTSAGTLIASNGFTMTTGALSQTSTSGAISSTGLTALTYTLSSGTAAITAPTLNLNTSSTGNTAIGNATGTFALTSNGGLNVTTGGALTGVASIDTIAVTATGLTFAGAGTISSTTSSAITVDSGTTGTVNLGTGNNAKTINLGTGTAGNTINIGTNNTVADAINIGSALDTTILTGTVRVSGLSVSSAVYTDGSSNLTTTAPTSGTIGYWSRSGTTLSPATANDIVSIATTNTTGADLALTNSGIYTGTGIFNLTANSATTGVIANISGTGLTSGNGLLVTGSSATPGQTAALVKITGNAGRQALDFSTFNTMGLYQGQLNSTTTINSSSGGYSTNAFFEATNSPTSSANRIVGLRNRVVDATTLSNINWGIYNTAENTGALSSGTKTVISLETNVVATGSTAGTTNATGIYISGGSVSHAANAGTITQNQIYIENGTSSTNGTSTKRAIALEPMSGADTNYGICFDCDGTWSVSSSASGLQFGSDANAVNLYRNGSDTLQTDDNLAISGTTGLTFDGVGGQINFTNGETIDNDTDNQVNIGLGTSGTLLLTSSTAATITNSAGALNINAQATGLNLQADGSIDVNLAGGSSATGCTVNNTTGDLTCSGTISGGGSVGYWQRSGTTLSPATAGDNITTTGNISTTGTGTITSAGTLTASNGFTQTTGALNLTATSGAISATGLTSATLSVTSGTLALATATAGDITLTNGAATGLVNVLTGNLKVGNGVPGVTLNGEDAYIEGTFEVDGSSQFDGTLTANGTFDANGQFDLGDGGDAGTISATTLDIDATGALQINSSAGAISIGNDAVAQAINIGTGAAARTITIGNGTGATALNLTSGTGAQTFTSSVVSGTTTTSAFVLNASSLTTGTALYVSSTATSGKTVDINASQTSGTIFNLAYGSAKTITGDLIGLSVDLNSGNVDATNQNITGVNFKIPTVTDTHTSGTKTLTGMLVNFGSGAGINQNGAGGTLEYVAGDFYMPALTQTAGTLNAYGTRVITPATITTGGTAYGSYISATGVGAGTLYGVGVSNITGGSGTEYAFNVAGTGWDAVLRVGSTTVINGSGVTQVPGGGTGLSTVTQNGVVYGNAASNLGVTAAGTTGQVLIATTGSAPSWGTISGSTCTNCLVTDPSADQTIAPTGQGTTGLSVRQTSTASPTDDIFQITSSDGATKYFYVDNAGNVSTAGTSAQTLTLTPLTDTTALTLVGTNVSSQPLQYINSKNASATTGIINMAYGAAQTLTGSVIGFRQDLSTNVTATNQSVTGYQITLPGATNTSGTQAYTGISISGGSLNENGGTATTFTGASITVPAITQTSGTLTAYGANVTTPSSITTAGTAYGYNVAATGVGAGTLYGLNISDITAGAGTEVGAQIGSGWDTNLLFNDTTTRVGLANGGTLTILDTAGNSLCTLTDSGTTGDLSCTGTISGGGSVGYWSRTGTTLSTVNAGDNVTVDGTTTANGTFDANGQFDLGDGGDAGTISATTLDIDATGALQINSSGGAISIGNDAVAQNINVGTGAAARTITIGNATGATALAFNSGTGSQTFTSQVVSGTTTTSGFVFDSTALTTGTGSYFTSDSITQGKLMQIATTGNTLTTGTLADIRTTSTALTGAAGTGSLLNLDWTPGSATTATGDLFSLNIGANGSTTGSLFNILDSSASIFSVSETTFTTSLPSNFTSSGDVSIAYDLNFTNPVASYIKSYSALTIQPGDPFGSSNLTLSPYNEGSVYIPSNVATAYGVDVDANLLSSGAAMEISSTSTAGTASGNSYLLSLSRSGANSNATHVAYGISASVLNTGTTAVNIAGAFTASGASLNYALATGVITSVASGTNYQLNTGNITGAASATSASINTGTISGAGTASYGINLGANSATATSNYGINIGAISGAGTTNRGIYIGAVSGATNNYEIAFAGTSPEVAVADGGTITISDGTNTLCTIADAGTTGNLTCTGNISGSSSGSVGFWTRTGTTLTTATAADNVTVDGTFDANGVFTIGDGGDTGALSSTTLDIDATGALQINSSGGAISIGNDAVAQAIDIGTGAAARTITIGNTTGATGLVFNSGSADVTITGDVLPATNDTYALGADASRWSDVFVGPSTVHIGTSTTDEGTISYNTTSNIFNFGTDSTTNADIAFFTDDLYLDKSTGHVAIGNTAPGSRLSVTISSAGDGLGVYGNTTGLLSPQFSLYDTSTQKAAFGLALDNNHYSAISVPGDAVIRAVNAGGSGGNVIITAQNSTGNIKFATGTSSADDTAKMTILNGGNVGIGDASPASLFTVGSGDLFQVNSSGAIAAITGYTQASGAFAFSGAGNFSVDSAAFDVTTAGVISGVTGYTQASGTFSLTAADASLINLAAVNVSGTGEGLILPQNATACSASTAEGQICWDTAGEDLYIGNGATAVQMNTGGSSAWSAITDPTGDQTLAFGDGEQNIWTVSSDTETFWSMTADSMTTGDLFDISLDGLTTGTGFQMQSTSTALTGTAGIGSLMNLEWAPGSSTTATGDLFSLNIGANGSTTGNLFNILDSSSSIFSVSETAFTTSLPSNFTAAGDVAVAYDLNFTNPTASYIKSAAPLAIISGETFNSSNLTLGTYNEGTIALQTNNITGTAVDLTNSTLTTGTGINAAFSAMTTGTGVSITSSGSAQTAGSLLSVVQSGTTTGFTGDVVRIVGSGTTGSGGTVMSLTGANTTAGTVLEVVGNTVTTTNGRVMTLTANALTSGIGLNISSSSNITSGNLVNIAQTGTTTQQAAATVAMSTTATTNASARLLTLTANSMTAGTVQTISSTTTAWGAGTMFGISKTGASGNTAFSGDIANITYSHTFNSTGTLDHSGNVLDMSRTLSLTGAATQTVSGAQLAISDSLTVNNASGTFTYTAPTVSITRAVTRTSGAITNSGNLMTLTSSDASHTGNTLSIVDSATHASGGNSLLITASATTGDVMTITSSSLTTGSALTLTGPTGTGVTDHFMKVTSDIGADTILANFSPDFNHATGTGYGVAINATDATTNTADNHALFSSLSLSANAQKTNQNAMRALVSSTSTSADTVSGLYVTTSITGALTSGTRNVYGVRSEPTASNATTASSTTNVYGVYAKASGNITSTGSINNYGVYIANGSYDAGGTSTAYGLYIAAISGADSNYGAYISSGVAIGDQASTTYGFEVYKATTTYAASITNLANSTSSLGLNMRAGNDTSGTFVDFRRYDNTPVGSIQFSGGNTTAYNTTSDRRLKTGITETSYGLEDLLNIEVSDYRFISDSNNTPHTGFIAQDLYNIYPEAVTVPTSDDRFWMVDYGKVTPLIVKSIQDLNYKVENALLTINPDGTTNTNLNVDKITVSGDAKIGGLVSASNFALDATLLNRSGAMASVPVSGDNKITLADTVNSLNTEINTLDSRLSTLGSNQASQSAALAEARILGEQAVNHAETLDEKVASTSANLSSLSSRIDDLLASISGSTPEASDSSDTFDSSSLTPPTELIATDSATFTNIDVTESLSTLRLSSLDATVSGTFKSLGETFLGQTTIAGDLSVDGTLSFTNGNSINAFPTLFFQNNPLAQAVDFFNGKITLDKDGVLAAQSLALGDQSLGTATIDAGQTEITIPSEIVASDSRIFLTPESAITGNIYVGQKVTGSGFIVRLSQPNPLPVKFNWMIVQTKESI